MIHSSFFFEAGLCVPLFSSYLVGEVEHDEDVIVGQVCRDGGDGVGRVEALEHRTVPAAREAGCTKTYRVEGGGFVKRRLGASIELAAFCSETGARLLYDVNRGLISVFVTHI